MDFEAAEFATDAESAIDAGAFAARAEDTDGDPEIDLAPGPVMGAASGPEAKVARDPDALDPPLAPAVAWNEVWRLVTIHPPMASRTMKAPMMGQRDVFIPFGLRPIGGIGGAAGTDISGAGGVSEIRRDEFETVLRALAASRSRPRREASPR